MKTKTLLFAGLWTFAPVVSKANIFRVNPSPVLLGGCSTCYTTITAAMSAASTGDTIHLEGADVTYGNATFNKQLVVIGTGYKLGSSPNNDSLQASTKLSTLEFVTINAAGSGTVLLGIRIAGTNGRLDLNGCSNVRIQRCFFDQTNVNISSLPTSNILIAECYFGNGSIRDNINVQTITNFVVRNCYINGDVNIGDSFDTVTNTVFAYNTINYPGLDPLNLKNAEVTNNLFYAGSVVTGMNNAIHDNLSATALPIGPNNTNNQTASMLLVGVPVAGLSEDGKWNMPPSVYAPGGVDSFGMYSGASPYRLSGIPNIPTIYQLSSTVNAVPGGNVEVTLSTRTNP